MTRCVAAAALALLACALPAQAQLQRNFPATALRGELVVTQPPDVLLNGQPARLAPGSRIRDEANMVVLSASLVQRRLPVHFTLDRDGMIFDVWVLTPAELARKPWPSTPAQATRWAFDPLAQTWSRP